jgi:hypothetical protein
MAGVGPQRHRKHNNNNNNNNKAWHVAYTEEKCKQKLFGNPEVNKPHRDLVVDGKVVLK